MTVEGDEEEVSFADEQLRKAVRRSQASMKPEGGAQLSQVWRKCERCQKCVPQ